MPTYKGRECTILEGPREIFYPADWGLKVRLIMTRIKWQPRDNVRPQIAWVKSEKVKD